MPESKKKEYTSIRVDPDLWKEVKIQAIREDIEVSELMERALRKELDFARKGEKKI
jgi:predicted transcriptional regulator